MSTKSPRYVLSCSKKPSKRFKLSLETFQVVRDLQVETRPLEPAPERDGPASRLKRKLRGERLVRGRPHFRGEACGACFNQIFFIINILISILFKKSGDENYYNTGHAPHYFGSNFHAISWKENLVSG